MSVAIRQVNPPGPSVVLELVDDDQLTGGVGGWTSLDRTRRSSVTVWTGSPAQTYVLPLLLDGMEVAPGVDVPVEVSCDQLIAWGVGDVDDNPPVLQVTGEVIVPGTSRWVLQDLSWGAKERDAAGRRIQQAVTVTLLAYASPVLLKSPAKKSRQNKPKAKAKGKDDDGKPKPKKKIPTKKG